MYVYVHTYTTVLQTLESDKEDTTHYYLDYYVPNLFSLALENFQVSEKEIFHLFSWQKIIYTRAHLYVVDLYY